MLGEERAGRKIAVKKKRKTMDEKEKRDCVHPARIGI